MRKETWFGLSILVAIVAALFWLMPAPDEMTNGHLGLLMLALVVVAIMLGFPTAFTLMGMGVIFAWFAFHSQDPGQAVQLTLDLMVQRAYSVMANDVLISIPLFIFMGYLVERANLIERLFKSLHIAMARVPGSLAVATIVTCAIFATATGIVGAVVTLMGLLALPAMLKAGYSTQLSAGCITAGGCLGILIPPSVLLIVYGATAGVSVVKLYAGALFPGIMLAALYVGYVLLVARLKPSAAPPLPAAERVVELPAFTRAIPNAYNKMALSGLVQAFTGARLPRGMLASNLFVALLPALAFILVMGASYRIVTAPEAAPTELVEMSAAQDLSAPSAGDSGGLQEPPAEGGLAEPPVEGGLAEPPLEGAPPATPATSGAGSGTALSAASVAPSNAGAGPTSVAADPVAKPATQTFWIVLAVGAAALAVFYLFFSFARLEIFKMLLGSLFPLAIMILAVLGSIVFGLATPTEAAAMGAFGGLILAIAYRRFNFNLLRESAHLTTKTTAMVCWLFVGSSIFSAAFALLGGQEIINAWVLGMELTPVQFMVLAQVVIFLLGWPLEWTEIIVIFMPIFVPLLAHFNIDPLFFGLLVAMNLQTAFLSPPVAMSAFYLKGVAPPHVTLNQIFMGMLPFMGIQVLGIALLYAFPAIGLWLPGVLYK
ncbi:MULTISPECIES: TRAP transporter large permease subunit [unclassified Massilia]|uniref:TRAP transporter large permease subunit n=1 Tax=unclassified Massilia TaxID=2609279 RepID=UPI00177B9A29|nr:MULTISPECIES: TRAP transporter large permease subunit [unclassified Massilia]MBD8528480.1 TRAP transporter large permease subunit [Massilia sp. CFBP 13647]MBD8671897.1 TRAP transporter large permease subunit [Massilia sp. CFBP 13721]